MADSDASAIETFVPGAVRRALATGDVELPHAEPLHAALVFADISGFTRLSERLAREGPAGAERLGEILNATFDQLIERIHAHGGETVKFAGDALLATFAVSDAFDLPEACERATRCGLELAQLVHGREILDDATLSLRVSIAAGDVFAAHLGGVAGRRELVIAGEPLESIAVAEHEAEPGEVVLTPHARRLVGSRVIGDERGNECLCASEVASPRGDAGAPAVAAPPCPTERLRPYVPRAVLAQLDAGHGDWLNELRVVSSMFIGVGGVVGSAREREALLQSALVVVQTAVERYDGHVNKLLIDDKGTTVLAAFGLPPTSHEDDPLRAVRCGLQVRDGLRAAGLTASIGITTGRVFAGAVGGTRRREYTILGDAVNAAARLMQAADQDVLCDEATARAAGTAATFEAPVELSVKGKDAPLVAFAAREVSGRRERSRAGSLVGRAEELQRARRALDALGRGAAGALVVSGDAGVGKSRLVEELVSQARGEAGVRVVRGAADALDQATPYLAWREVIGAALDLAPGLVGKELAAAAAERLAVVAPDRSQQLPLLATVLGCEIPDSAFTRGLAPKSRAEWTVELCAALLGRAAQQSPLLCLIEDGHWLDSASASLLQAASRVAGVLAVVTTRPLGEGRELLVDKANTERIELGPLSAAGVAQIIAERLKVDEVDEALVDFVEERAHGNPYFVEEIVLALDEDDAVVVDGRRARGRELGTFSLPTTVEGIVTHRVDRLEAGEQLVLKCAAVVGHRFPRRAVAQVFPIEEERAQVDDRLGTLSRFDLTLPGEEETEPHDLFKHAITRDVAYNMLLFSQRARLHEAAGEWYEHEHEHDLGPWLGVLAHHFSLAKNEEKALRYLDAAGLAALRADANREAVDLLTRAQQADDADDLAPEARLRRAERLRRVAEARMGSGAMMEGVDDLKRALAELGVGGDATGTPSEDAVRAHMESQIALQEERRATPAKRMSDGLELDRTLGIAQVGYRMAQCYYYAGFMVSAVTSALVAVNHAEHGPPSPLLARLYAMCAIAFGLLPDHDKAAQYDERARALARELDDTSAESYVLFATSLYEITAGEFGVVDRSLTRAAELFEALGERKDLAKSRVALANSAALQGRYGDALAGFRGVEERARKVNDRQQEAWGKLGAGTVLSRQGDDEHAGALLEEAAPLFEASFDRNGLLAVLGLRARLAWRRGDLDEAERFARDGLTAVHELAKPTVYTSIEGYAGVTETFLSLAAAGRSTLEDARDALSVFERCEAIFPISRPRAACARARLTALDGDRETARAAAARAVQAAEGLGMPWELALAWLTVARLAPGASREDAARRALDGFETIGARAGVREALALLG
jgi:predicted ATPase